MKELIKTQQNESGDILVTGRDLHEFLEIGTRYDIWFNRMTEYGFIESVDYVEVVQKRTTSHGRLHNMIDHHIKLDMAKEISMLQRNEKGKQARQYFIEVEKRWNSPEMIVQRALQIQQQKIEELTITIEEQAPKVETYNQFINAEGLYNMKNLAQHLDTGEAVFREDLPVGSVVGCTVKLIKKNSNTINAVEVDW